jgi:cell division initiation protein
MNISSKDIKKRDFKKGIRGYDSNEVDAFLDTVSLHYEKLVSENKTQADRIKSLVSDIDIYKENEVNLQKALIKSQELGDEIIQNAKKTAQLIVREAELNVKKSRQELDESILDKKHELDDIKLKNEKLLDDIKNYLNDKLIELEEFIKNKKIFKMELTSLSRYESAPEETETKISEEKKSVKKVYISSQSGNTDSKGFEDTFELK